MRIGRYAEGKGGIYAGIVIGVYFDSHVFLSPMQSQRDIIFVDAIDFAATTRMDDHADFRLPNVREGALLYANLQSHFADLWYWLGDLYHADKNCAWVQTFGYGRQADARLTDACRACAVRTERVE